MHFYTKEMIENTWRWARENGKIIKHAVSGGEFVEIDVEHFKRKTDETGQRMTQSAVGHFQACGWLMSFMHAWCHSCMHASSLENNVLARKLPKTYVLV